VGLLHAVGSREIMIDKLHLQVRDSGMDWTSRELKLIEMIVMRVCAHAKLRFLSEGMKIRPIPVESIYLLLNHLIVFETPITEEVAMKFISHVQNDINQTLQICDVPVPEILLTVAS
jgi:hypothetical protein